ncbi:hypothetical protein DFH28DRAFT_977565 [Melampsora americana]|nr:hypothetical protein DFH28DRAFT_977565 [Melampsora americana]
MPTIGRIECQLLPVGDSSFREQSVSYPNPGLASSYLALDASSDLNDEHPYSLRWTIDPSILKQGGLQVQIEVDGCQKGQIRCYEAIPEDGLLPASIHGCDDGLWVVPDGTRRRPWIMTKIKTTHPHSALADKYILDRVGSVNVTFKRANVVPTSHVVPLPPVFNGGAPLPERMHEKISHWTKLGYIQNHPVAPELGLVAEAVGEVIAQFTFHYRSQDLLNKLAPIGTTGLTVNFPTQTSATELRFSFPTSPDAESLRSTEAKSPSLSGSLSLPTKSGNSSNALRRALSSHNTPRNSVDDTSPSEKETEKNDFGKLNKLGGKRVRAVSLRLSKRYSLLGNKSSGDKKEEEVKTTPQFVESSSEDLSTIEGLRKEVISLRLEISNLKRHLNL